MKLSNGLRGSSVQKPDPLSRGEGQAHEIDATRADRNNDGGAGLVHALVEVDHGTSIETDGG